MSDTSRIILNCQKHLKLLKLSSPYLFNKPNLCDEIGQLVTRYETVFLLRESCEQLSNDVTVFFVRLSKFVAIFV